MTRRRPQAYVWCPFCNWYGNASNGGEAREIMRHHIEHECAQVVHPFTLDKLRSRAEELPEAVTHERLACAQEVVNLRREVADLRRREQENTLELLPNMSDLDRNTRRLQQSTMIAAYDTAERAIRARRSKP